MKKYAPETVTITRVKCLTSGYYSMSFGPVQKASRCKPGQFLQLRLPDSSVYLRRPMSIAAVDCESRQLEVIFKVVGRGTTLMARMKKNDQLDLLGPLGNWFDLPRRNETSMMIAGGVGFPPLLYLATEMIARGHDPARIIFAYGGRSRHDILEQSRLRKLGIQVHYTTEDGSLGQRGLVTQTARECLTNGSSGKIRIFSCGPEPMLKAVDQLALELGLPGQLSLEAPMPCGFGVCLGCVVELTTGGYARVCQEGPIFKVGEVVL